MVSRVRPRIKQDDRAMYDESNEVVKGVGYYRKYARHVENECILKDKMISV